jgi:hypothetical protein
MTDKAQELITKINSKEYGRPILSGRNLNRIITPEVGWLLACMDKRADAIIMRSNNPRMPHMVQGIMTATIKDIARDGKAASSWRRTGRTKYYKTLAGHALDIEKLGETTVRPEPITTQKPESKGTTLMLSDRKINRHLEKINKANGINIALRYQAEATLAASRKDLVDITEALRNIQRYNANSAHKDELISTAKMLDKKVIPAQEKNLEQLTEMVRAGREAVTKLNEALRNKRLSAATKTLIKDVQRIKALPDVDTADLNLNRETLKAYNEIQDSNKDLENLDNEEYLKELLARH